MKKIILSDIQIQEIIDSYREKHVTYKSLSNKYGVSITLISRIIKEGKYRPIINTKFDRRYKIPVTSRNEIYELHSQGVTAKKLGIIFGLSVSRVREIIRDFDNDNGNKTFERPTQTVINNMIKMRESGASFKVISNEFDMDLNKVYYYINRKSTLTNDTKKPRKSKPILNKKNNESVEKYRQHLIEKGLI